MKVAIVGLGPSHMNYIRMAEGLGDWRTMFDEVWTVNGFSNVLQNTRGFAMDDVRIQQIRAAGGNKKVANLLEAYKHHPGPIYTSRPHPDFPSLVEYPLEAVVNTCGQDYFNSTIAYPICLAIHEGAESIAMYGADYTFPDRNLAEEGRACCEYWLGVASARGINVGIAGASSLLDANKGNGLYGYDLVKIVRDVDENGWCKISFEEKPESEWPTAEEIEKRYYKGDGQPIEATA